MRPMEILIASDRAQLSAKLADNEAGRALAAMLPLKIQMRDHRRQEKTGVLPSALPDGDRKTEFSVGTLGLWGDRDFVIYYRAGHVPPPGIVVLGHVRGDLSLRSTILTASRFHFGKPTDERLAPHSERPLLSI